jgi:hypothetical protein
MPWASVSANSYEVTQKFAPVTKVSVFSGRESGVAGKK